MKLNDFPETVDELNDLPVKTVAGTTIFVRDVGHVRDGAPPQQSIVHVDEMLNRDGQPVPMDFDRCSPSIIAFAKRAAAESFASEHGGHVGVFLQIVARPLVVSLP